MPVLKKNDRRVEVNFQAAESQINSYLDIVEIQGFYEGTKIKKAGTGILMKDVPDI